MVKNGKNPRRVKFKLKEHYFNLCYLASEYFFISIAILCKVIIQAQVVLYERVSVHNIVTKYLVMFVITLINYVFRNNNDGWFVS